MPPDNIELEIEKSERKRMKALLAQDFDALKDLLTDDLVHIHTNGSVEDKADYIKTMSTKYEILKIDRPLLNIRVTGDIAIVTGPLNQNLRIRESGALVEIRAIATQVWVKKAEGWKQNTFHATRLG